MPCELVSDFKTARYLKPDLSPGPSLRVRDRSMATRIKLRTGWIFPIHMLRRAVVLPNRHQSQTHFKTLESSGCDLNWQKEVTLVYLFYTARGGMGPGAGEMPHFAN
jgi:hypothetical protein